MLVNNIIRWIKEHIPFMETKRSEFFKFHTHDKPAFIYESLIPFGYQTDYISYTEKGEVLNIRYLYDKRQIHIRVYKDDEVRMHDEYNYEFYPIAHLNGESVRKVDRKTVEQLKEILHGY